MTLHQTSYFNTTDDADDAADDDDDADSCFVPFPLRPDRCADNT